MAVFRDFIEIIIKLGAIFVIIYNEWSNDEIALKYLKYFYRYTRSIGIFRLLILDGYSNHAIFRFKKLAYEYKIILLYLPTYTIYRLQLLNIYIFKS